MSAKGTTNRLLCGTDLGVFFSDERSDSMPDGTECGRTYQCNEAHPYVEHSPRVHLRGRGIWEIDVRQCTAAPTITKVTPTTACEVILLFSSIYEICFISLVSGDTTRRVVFRSIMNGELLYGKCRRQR
ncbi:MAG: hypothetical protein IPP80_13875 [Ignavibacteria bacterium]|nr:hypothetical protein [Ignavibacteria bacterium]